jgi:multiple sugar transport system substrate-binding protein
MWNADHPDTKAKIVELPQATNGQRSQMIAQAKANSGEVDIFNLDVTMLAEFAAPPGEDPFILPVDESRLSPEFLDGFLDNPLDTCRYDNTLWALPLNTDAGLLYYREDLVPEPPGEWDELVDIAQQVPAPPSVAAYTTQFADYEGMTVNVLEAIWDEGGDVVDANGKVVADSETMSRGIRRFMDTSGGPRPVLHPDTGTFNEADSREAFARGEVLFMRNWPVQHSTLLNNDTPDVSKPKRIPFGVTTLPGPSALGGQNLAVAAKSDAPRAAQDLIEFMTQDSSQLLLARYGGFAPTRKAPYRDKTTTTHRPYLSTLQAAVESANLRPITPYYPYFSDAVRDIVRIAMANGGEPPKDFGVRLTRSLQGR